MGPWFVHTHSGQQWDSPTNEVCPDFVRDENTEFGMVCYLSSIHIRMYASPLIICLQRDKSED